MPYHPEIHHRRSIRLKGYDYSQEGLYFITICVQDRECLFGEIVVVGAPLRGRPESNINGYPESEINGCKQMILNDAGKMAERWYRELENKYPDKRCHEMVIMPNHFHCIIENMGGGLQLDNDSQTDNGLQSGDCSQLDNGLQLNNDLQSDNGLQSGDCSEMGGVSQMGAHVGAPLRGRPSIVVIDRPIINIKTIDENGHPIIDKYDQQNDIERGEPNDEKYGLHNKKYNATFNHLVDWFKTMTTNEYMRGVKNYEWKRFDGKLWQRNYYEHIIRSEEEYERIADYIVDNPEKWQDDKFFKIKRAK